MAKCNRCGKSLFLKKTFQLKDAIVCERCANEMELDRYAGLDYYSYNDVKDGYEAYKQRKNKTSDVQKTYFFLVHDLDGEFIEKYRKENIDKEDRFEGMTFNDIRDNFYTNKVYMYPELDVYLEFKETTLDGNPALEVYLDDHMVGYVPKTKVSKTKKLLADDNVSWSAELYGGDYRILKGNYVEEWFDKVNIKVTFTWIEKNG